MLCYRDQTWCADSNECNNSSCFRLLTQKDLDKANELGLYISVSSFKEGCTSFIPFPAQQNMA